MTSYNEIHNRFLNEVHPDFLNSYIIIDGAYGDFNFLLGKNKKVLTDKAYKLFSKDIYNCIKHSNNSIKFNDVSILKHTIRKAESFYNKFSNEPIESLNFVKPSAYINEFHRTLFVCSNPIYDMALCGAQNVFKQQVLDDMSYCENKRDIDEKIIEHSIRLRQNGDIDICIQLKDIDLRGMNHIMYHNFVETLIYLNPLSNSIFIKNIRNKLFDRDYPDFKEVIRAYISSLMIQQIKVREDRNFYMYTIYDMFVNDSNSDSDSDDDDVGAY